jgi:hypothetical protein
MAGELLREHQLSPAPDRILILVDPDAGIDTMLLGDQAVYAAREVMPKVTGHLVTTLVAIYGDNFFGIYFPDRRVWFQEQGTRAFTMTSLQGKTVPMWIDDPTGAERRANPKAKVRTTVDGRSQVLIFRRAGVKGTRRMAPRRGPGGTTRRVSVPTSYPGAPGRIARREAAEPFTTPGRVGGRITYRNIGVRWHHPGITGRRFLNYAVTITAAANGVDAEAVYLADSTTLFTLLRNASGGRHA